MTKRFAGTSGMFGLFVLLVVFAVANGCSREQPSQSPQTSAPAVTAPQAQAPPPAATTAPAPQATGSPQYGAPSSPQTAPAPTVAGPQNSGQVQMGMTSQQVMDLMGNPGRVKQERQMVEWEYYTPQGKFEVHLQNDRVVSISRH